MKYYVVSDIHGFYDLLIESLNEAGYFNDTTPHKLIILGDFFDRGSQAKELEKFLVDLINKDDVILIKGNHEDLVEEFIDNIDRYTPYLVESHHFRNSTVDTVCQLTGLSLVDIYDQKEKCVELTRKTKFFTDIIPKCINYYETKNYVFVHGFIPSFVDDMYGRDDSYIYNPSWREETKEEWEYARWYNGMRGYKCGVRVPDKTIVCGHWHCSWGHHYLEGSSEEFGEGADFTPFYGDGLICIDGCVPRSNHVNCIVIEDEEMSL